MKFVAPVISRLLSEQAHTVTLFMDAKNIVRATRRAERGKLPRRGGNLDVVLTIGKPNYRERQFIKSRVKDGASFPFRHIRYFPQRKRAR